MLTAPRYLAWALRHYDHVSFDLATSGIPHISPGELGEPAQLDEPDGPARLRGAIAHYCGVGSEEVVAALGTTHALWLAYAVLVGPGDDVLVEAPSYEPVWHLAAAAGANVIRFERPPSEGFVLDPYRVEAAMTPRTRLVAVTDLHNPSGVRADAGALHRVAEVVAKRGAWLLVDEVYAPFDALCDARGAWGESARRVADNVLAVGSLTKCYGLGPERIGWLLGPRTVVEQAEGALLASCGRLPLQHANLGVHLFGRLPALAKRARGALGTKRSRVSAWVRERGDFQWSVPREGLFGFAWSRHGDEDWRARIEAGIKAEGVIVAPGAFFGVQNGFRLGWALPDSKLEEALTRLGRVLGPS